MKKIILFSIVVILVLGGAAGAYWWISRPQVIRFSDDATVTLLGVDYGKRHAVPGGKLPPAPPAAPGRPAVARRGNGSFTTATDTLVVWVRAEYDYSANQYHGFQFYIYDKAGTACAQSMGSRNVSGNQRGDDILAVQFDAFPRRQGQLYLRVQEQGNGGQEMAEDKFVINNPATGKSFAKWTPEPLPATKVEDGLSITLTKLVAGAEGPYQRSGVDLDDAINKGVQVVFHAERGGKPVTDWEPVSVETTDATGNRAYGNGGNQSKWNGDEATAIYQYGLWPDEPAWKLRMEFTQKSGFGSDDQWTAQNIPVVPGSQQSFNNPGARGNQTATPVAETDLNGHHIKVFPAMQFTNLPANLPANYPMQGGVNIQFTPALMNTGMRMNNGVNGTQMTDDGVRIALVKLTDDQGNDIENGGYGSSMSGMGTPNSSSTYRYNLRDIAGVTNVNLTVVLHKDRFFEFTAKPEKAADSKP